MGKIADLPQIQLFILSVRNWFPEWRSDGVVLQWLHQVVHLNHI